MLECLSCYEEFEERTDNPNARVCTLCVPDFQKIDVYRCPTCGWDSTTDDCGDAMLEVKNKSYNRYLAIEYGGHPEDWTEVWKCPQCGEQFEYENGS